MARAALQWGVRELARKARVSPSTVNRFETDQGVPNNSTLAVLRQALEAGGVRFTDDGCVCPPQIPQA